MTAAADIREALHRRYNKADGLDQRYVCIEEARSGVGFDGNKGACDFLAINTWRGRGMELIGHEIKVSMADWRTELDNPDKAERFARYCRRWYVVVPADLAAKIVHEVPPAWGLLSLSDKGRLTERSTPEPRPDIADVPVWWWIGWLAQIDRQHKRRVPQLVAEATAAERDSLRAKVDEEVGRRLEVEQMRRGPEETEMLERVDKLHELTGINLRSDFHVGRFDRLAAMWRLVQSGTDVDHVVHQLRRTADALEGIGGDTQ